MPQEPVLSPLHAPEALSALLLEIGTEEVPARFLPLAISSLKNSIESRFTASAIGFSDVQTFATPRRMSAIVRGIPPLQREIVKEVFGPAKKIAFDSSGNPTKAAIGFAQSQGIAVEQLSVRQKDKGEYVVAVIRQKGSPVRTVLRDVLKDVVFSLHFPKSMRWGNGDMRFVRPIHWILAILDGEAVPFEVESIRSGNLSRGHRFLSPASFVIKDISAYLSLLENSYVIVNQEDRKAVIEKGIIRLSESVDGKAFKDESLLETVTYLVEYPVPVLCEFSPEYLSLPKELLITVMRDHQKYFAIGDAAGNLKPCFIVISNTKEENAQTIRKGAERVIRARFEDARFYYGDDRKKRLDRRIDDLRRVTFHDRLGSLHEKTERVAHLASFLSGRLCPDKKSQAERAAWLSKTDLISGVVGEFPELQGLMGQYYALNDGEDRAVAEAIREHYLPSYAGDRLPKTTIGSLISLADKIDNIVSFFAVGLTPTGSEDPFALRRQAVGALLIIMEGDYRISLCEIISEAEKRAKKRSPALSGEVISFMLQRLETILSSQQYEMDLVHSVMQLAGTEPLGDIKERIHALGQFTGDPGYNAFLLAIKRIHNIIPSTELPPFREDLLSEPPEKALCESFLNVRPLIIASLAASKYPEALATLSLLTGPVNAFFDQVLVMDKREEIRLNRLSLLREIRTTASQIADFSKLAEKK